MKKLMTVLIIFLMSFSVTACDFSDEFWDELYDGLDSIVDIDENDLPDQVDEETAKGIHSNGGAYIYWGEVMLYMDTSETIKVGIDDDMSQDLIYASIFAVLEFGEIDGIDVEYYIIEIDDLLIGEDGEKPDDYSTYTILITTYYDDDESNKTIAYNLFWFDEFNKNSGEIFQSTIRYNLYYMNDMSIKFMRAIAIHELAHSFGLDDLYQHSLKGISLMYYQMDINSGATLLTETLTPWDIANLEWFYKKEATE